LWAAVQSIPGLSASLAEPMPSCSGEGSVKGAGLVVTARGCAGAAASSGAWARMIGPLAGVPLSAEEGTGAEGKGGWPTPGLAGAKDGGPETKTGGGEAKVGGNIGARPRIGPQPAGGQPAPLRAGIAAIQTTARREARETSSASLRMAGGPPDRWRGHGSGEIGRNRSSASSASPRIRGPHRTGSSAKGRRQAAQRQGSLPDDPPRPALLAGRAGHRRAALGSSGRNDIRPPTQWEEQIYGSRAGCTNYKYGVTTYKRVACAAERAGLEFLRREE
jgi:hypothetical protein